MLPYSLGFNLLIVRLIFAGVFLAALQRRRACAAWPRRSEFWWAFHPAGAPTPSRALWLKS